MAEAFSLIDVYTISSPVAQLDIPIGPYASTYEQLLLDIIGLQPATDATGLSLRVSSDGGTTFDSGSSNYKFGRSTAASSGNDNANSTGANAIDLCGAVLGNDAHGGVNGQIIVAAGYNDSSRLTQFRYDLMYYGSSDQIIRNIGAGYRDATSAVDTLRLFCWSGNIASGKVKIIGLK